MSKIVQPTHQELKDPELVGLHAFYSKVFDVMEKMMERHESFGNWSFGGGIPRLKSTPTQKELGLWYGEKTLIGFAEPAAVSLALTPNECRVGLFLPNGYLQQENTDYFTLDERIQKVYGDKIPGVYLFSRKTDNRTLFDHVFREPPFDVDTLAKALLYVQHGVTENQPYFQMLVQRLSYIMITIWTGAIRVVYENGKTGTGTWIIWAESGTHVLPQHMHGLANAVLLRSNIVGDKVAIEIRTTEAAETIKTHMLRIGMPVLAVEKMEEC